MYTELKKKLVVCRKRHRCEWCNEYIEIGEQSHYRAYVWEEGFQTGYMHKECKEAMDEYPNRYDLEEGWMPGDFRRGSFEER